MPQNLADTPLKTVAIFDLDNTITYKDTYLAFLFKLLRDHPLRLFNCWKLPVAVMLYKSGMRDNSWLKETFLQAIAGGLTRQQLNSSRNNFLQQLLTRGVRPGALAAIKFHQQNNHPLVMATASFDFYVMELAQIMGFEEVICTQSCWDAEDKLIGKIAGKNCYGNTKLERLQEHFGENRQQLHLVGYSDHHTDHPFLEWVDKAVAVNPTEKLRQIAIHNKFEISDWEQDE